MGEVEARPLREDKEREQDEGERGHGSGLAGMLVL